MPRAKAAEEALWERSVRFALTVTPPVLLAAFLGAQSWLIYALVTATVAFAADTGGRPLARLVPMALGGFVVALGGATATLLGGSTPLLIAAFAVCGVIYALTESAAPVALTLSRFLCFSLAIGALYPPFGVVDLEFIAGTAAAAWLISVGWDGLRRRWRPSTAPSWLRLRAQLRASHRERRIFAVAVAVTIPLTYWTSVSLGLERPYWALLTLVLVLRVDFLSSRKLMVERFLGTVLGVLMAGFYARFFPNRHALMIGIVLAALARWPAQRQADVLGVAVLTMYVMLVIELIATARGDAGGLLEARVLDTAAGCAFALFALGLDRGLRWIVAACRPIVPRSSPEP